MTEAQRQIAKAKAALRKETGGQGKRAPERGGGIGGKEIPPPIYRSGDCVIHVLDMDGRRVHGQGGIHDIEVAHKFLDQAAKDRTVVEITLKRAQ